MKAPRRPRDLNQWAKRMVDIATGEASDRDPTPEEEGQDPHMSMQSTPLSVARSISRSSSKSMARLLTARAGTVPPNALARSRRLSKATPTWTM